jgi:hypothetical protein
LHLAWALNDGNVTSSWSGAPRCDIAVVAKEHGRLWLCAREWLMGLQGLRRLGLWAERGERAEGVERAEGDGMG